MQITLSCLYLPCTPLATVPPQRHPKDAAAHRLKLAGRVQTGRSFLNCGPSNSRGFEYEIHSSCSYACIRNIMKYMCIYIHIHMYTIFVCLYRCTQAPVHTIQQNLYLYTDVCSLCMYACMYVGMYVCTYAHTFLYISMCIYTHVYLCVEHSRLLKQHWRSFWAKEVRSTTTARMSLHLAAAFAYIWLTGVASDRAEATSRDATRDA